MLLHAWKIDLTQELARELESFTQTMASFAREEPSAQAALFFTCTPGRDGSLSVWSTARPATADEQARQQALVHQIEHSIMTGRYHGD